MGEESSCDAWLNRRESADELHRLAVAELVRRYNELAGQLNRPGSSRITATSVRQEYMSRIEAYSTELARRESVRQGRGWKR